MPALLPDGAATGAGAASLLLLGRSCGHTASPGSSSAAAGGHGGGYRGLAAHTGGGGWLGVWGRFWEPLSLLQAIKGLRGGRAAGPPEGRSHSCARGEGVAWDPGQGWRRWRPPCVPHVSLATRAPSCSASVCRGTFPPGQPPMGPCLPVAADLWPRGHRGGPVRHGRRPTRATARPWCRRPGASGTMPRGQRGRSPAAEPRPLCRGPDVTAEPGQCHRASSSPCG